MDLTHSTKDDMNNLRQDINELKRDMSSLINHMSKDASRDAQTMGRNMRQGTDEFMRNVSSEGQRGVKFAKDEIEAHPTLTAGLILGAAFMAARLLMK
jgi:ElaB/YqjD/DUF883 family membrane-anchored ribosome-binding protein